MIFVLFLDPFDECNEDGSFNNVSDNVDPFSGKHFHTENLCSEGITDIFVIDWDKFCRKMRIAIDCVWFCYLLF